MVKVKGEGIKFVNLDLKWRYLHRSVIYGLGLYVTSDNKPNCDQ